MNINILVTVAPAPGEVLNHTLNSIQLVIANEAVDNLITEGGDDFYNYVNRMGLIKDQKLIILSSRHGYYYDDEEMKNADTIINLKELNQISQLKDLLFSHLHYLSGMSNYVGCFINNQKAERYGLRPGSSLSRNMNNSDAVDLGIISSYPFVNRLYSMMDSKTNIYMSEKSVTLILSSFGFRVLNMTEHNGLTYFHAQKSTRIYN